MTAPAAVNITEYEFSIPCEYYCGAPAIVMCKGCADKAHAALCHHHLEIVQQRFDSNVGKVICDNCNRPWLDFTTHYEVIPL